MEMPGDATLTNPVKERMKAGEVALGLNVRIARSGDIARIAKTTGHDFIFIDVQHSLFSLETIGHIAQSALGCGVAPLARVRSCGDPDAAAAIQRGPNTVAMLKKRTSQKPISLRNCLIGSDEPFAAWLTGSRPMRESIHPACGSF